MPVSPPKVPRDRITVAILAGGQSTRFGSDKALALVPGTQTSFLERAIMLGRSVADQVLIVGPVRPGIDGLGACTVSDYFPGQGPVGGVVTALDATNAGYLVVLSCDQPFVSASDVRLLLTGLPGKPAAVFAHDEGPFHPLPCALDVAQCQAKIRVAFATGTRSLMGLLRQCGAEEIQLPGGAGWKRLLDIDTREELRRLSGRVDPNSMID